MVLDMVALLLLVGALVIARRVGRSELIVELLPPDDQPPLEADEPMPRVWRRAGYVDAGLTEIETWLAGRDQDA